MMEMEKDLHVERKNTEKAFNEYLPKSILCHVKEKKVMKTEVINDLKDTRVLMEWPKYNNILYHKPRCIIRS